MAVAIVFSASDDKIKTGGVVDFWLKGFGGPGGDQNDQTESAAILKIKESMQEEAKRFEKDPDHPDYYMQWAGFVHIPEYKFSMAR